MFCLERNLATARILAEEESRDSHWQHEAADLMVAVWKALEESTRAVTHVPTKPDGVMPACAANMGSAEVSSREPRSWAHDAKHICSFCRSACAEPHRTAPALLR